MVSPNATNSKVSVSIEYTKSSVGLRTKEIFTHTHTHTQKHFSNVIATLNIPNF